jgi:hypothetical protein
MRRMGAAFLTGIFMLLTVTLAAGTAGAAEPGAGRADNGCIRCHQHLPEGTRIAKRHLDFFGSIHDKAGVVCSDCHGGDPTQDDKAKAHQGVLPAANPDSRIYFRTIPSTCGRCHQTELAAFTKSRHFARLETSGRGPNCVTCHGSMATHVLSASDVQGFCTVCHNERLGVLPDKPAQAETTLRMMEAVRTLLAWGREFAAQASAKGADTATADAQLAEGAKELGEAGRTWHTFNLPAIQGHLDKAIAAAVAAKAALPANR